MIPFVLKQAWFWLALTGLVQCWILLVVLPGRRYAGLWGRLYYCTFLTLLEGIFCLGMIWEMNPLRMPRAFCLVQVVLISLGSFALTGVCASFAVANALAVFRPQSFDSGRAVLAWNVRYIPFVIVFPILASGAHIALLLTLNPVRPSLSDDLHCDATSPVWMRLVGYAGVPLVVSIPFLCLSFYTAVRLYKMSRARFFETFSTMDADGAEASSPGHSYELNENRRRSRAVRLTAFLPYPSVFGRSAIGFKPSPAGSASVCVVPETPADQSQTDFPLHHHPFPPVVTLTDTTGSPGPDASPDLSPPQFDRRTISSTPDSTFSSSMPEFAPNLQHGGKSPALTEPSVQLPGAEEGGDVQIGLAITTDDVPDGSQQREDLDGDKSESEEQVMGFAVTTDEPDTRSITPAARQRSPTQQMAEAHRNSPPSDVLTLHALQLAQNAATRPEPLSKERARSSDSTSRTLLPSPRRFSHETPTDLSSLKAVALREFTPQPRSPHRTSATFLVTTDEGDGEQLTLTPVGAGSPRTQVTPKIDYGIDLVLDLLPDETAAPDAGQQDDSHMSHKTDLDQKGHKWEWDDVDGSGEHTEIHGVHVRVPEKRPGIYNPTPATPIEGKVRRQMFVQQKKEVAEHGTKKLMSATWRLVLFQIAFFSVQLLASLSTILDVARGTITPFGTQHVALLLAAWGPLFIFFRIPDHNTLYFWRAW